MFESFPYFLILLMAAVPALTVRGKRPSFGWVIYGLLLLIFIGLRHETGSDWSGYMGMGDRLSAMNFDELLQQNELAFSLVFWGSLRLGLELYGVNMLITAIFLYGLFKYCKTQLNPWLAIYTALPYLVIVVAMSATRQTAAIGFTLLALAGWNQSSLNRKLFLIAMGSLFHTSAAIFGIFVILGSKLSLLKKAVLGSGLLVVVVAFLGASDRVLTRYQTYYFDDATMIDAPGAMQQVMLLVIPAIIFLIVNFKNRNFKALIPHGQIIYVMSIMSIALIPMAMTYSLAASRISFFLFPVSIAVMATIPEIFPASSRSAVKFLIVLYGFVTLGLWLNYANTAFGWFPYNNVLFSHW